MANRYETGYEVDGWTLESKLGSTQNSQVWKAERDGQTYAVKFLVGRGGGSRYQRFRDEVAFLRDMTPPKGVLPLLDSSLPDRPTKEKPAWLAMPVARTVREALGAEPAIGDVVACIRDIASTLAELASGQIAHRDIKPANLFELDGDWLVGDFGLVTYPDKTPVTLPNAKLGPAHFVADEMITNPDTADPHPADVFSLAKTLWVLSVPGQTYPPAGQHRIDIESMTIGHWVYAPRVQQLDLLVERATSHASLLRPTMAEFGAELDAWLDSGVRTELPALDDLAPRVHELSERGLRARAARESWAEKFAASSASLFATLGPVDQELARVFPAVGRHANPPGGDELWLSAPELQIEQQVLSAVFATNADPEAVELYVGLGARWVGDDDARYAGWIYLVDSYTGSRPLWAREGAAKLGSATEQRLFAEIANDLARELSRAAAFAVERMELRSDRDRYACWTGEESGVGSVSAPWGITCPFAEDDLGCYVIDSGNNRVLRFGPGGNTLPWQSPGGLGLGYDNLNFPTGGCFTHERKVWIADDGNQRLRYFDEHGQPLEGFGLDSPGSEVLLAPADVASDPEGSVYALDRMRHRVVKFSGSGVVLAEWGGDGHDVGEFSAPCGIAVRHGRFVYVSDTGNNRVQKFTSDGDHVGVWGSVGNQPAQFHRPHGIALDQEENVYVADSGNARVQQFTSDGEFMRAWGSAGTRPGQFLEPCGIGVDSLGNVYVSELRGNRIQRFAPRYLDAL
jgi:DNA-binding beta-propeller fold protein YncE